MTIQKLCSRMDRKLPFYFSAISMLVATSCSSDNEPTIDYSDTPISIEVGVCDLVTLSRSGSETGSENQAFGLYFNTEGATGDKYNASNLQVSYVGDAWTTGSKLCWKNNTGSVTYSAYSPYHESVESTFNIEIDGNNSAEDLLYAKSKTVTASENEGKISIEFSHMLSKLNVVLTKGSGLGSDVTFNSVQLDCCKTEATFNVTNGEVSAATGDDKKVTLTNSNSAYSAIIVPQNIASMKIVITGSNGKTYSYTSATSLTFVAGTQYSLNLTVGDETVVAGNISAAQWSSSDTTTDFIVE